MSRSIEHWLSITLDRGTRAYTPGEELTGIIAAKFSQPLKINALKVMITGEGKVSIKTELEKPNDPGETEWRETIGYENYICTESHLLRSDSGRPIELPSKQLKYSFRFQLPKELPSSIEGKYGHIRYTVTAIFETPYQADYKTKSDFTVISTYDLNEKPQAKLTIKEDVRKSFCYCCLCPWGKMHTIISLPSSGFVLGQAIPVTVYCENESCATVSKIKLKLRRKLWFFALIPARRTYEVETTEAEMKLENPFTNSFEDQVTVELNLPELPPSSLEFCGIMNLEYTLRVEICFSGMHCSIDRTFPILIGTIPLRDSLITQNSNAVMPPQPSAPILEQPSSSSTPYYNAPEAEPSSSFAPAYPSQKDAPPSYAATILGDQRIRNYGSVNSDPYAPVHDKR